MKLPDFAIADLYKDVLVEIVQPTTNKKIEINKNIEKDISNVSKNKTLKYLGENKKNIAIIVSNPNVVFTDEDDLIFITNVLKSIDLNLSDIALINLAAISASYKEMQDILLTQYFIFFGVLPSALSIPINVPHFQIQKYADFCFLTAPSIEQLNKETAEAKLIKTKLWVSLQNMFGL